MRTESFAKIYSWQYKLLTQASTLGGFPDELDDIIGANWLLLSFLEFRIPYPVSRIPYPVSRIP